MFSRLLCITAPCVTYFDDHLSLARLQLLSDRFPIRKLLLPSPVIVNLSTQHNSQCLRDPHNLMARVNMLSVLSLSCSTDLIKQAKPRLMSY